MQQSEKWGGNYVSLLQEFQALVTLQPSFGEDDCIA